MTQTNILLESGTNELEIVEFFVDERLQNGTVYRGYYGVNVAKVLEIIRMPQVTAMPEIPHEAVKGAFNLRSRVIPLIDLAVWMGKDREETEPPKAIVSEFNNVINAFLVTGVNRIHRLSWEQVEAPDSNLSKYSGDSITGVVRFDDRILMLLDLEMLVADINPSLSMGFDDEAERFPEGEKHSFKALIADDSVSIRRMIGVLLEKAGFEVTQTINGKMAWDKCLEFKAQAEAEGRDITEYLDVIVSDIEMPVMDGHNFTRGVKDDPVLGKLPVILFSSLITERLRHKGESVGADEQISKPDITSLTEKAFALIEERQGVKVVTDSERKEAG